MDNGNSSARDGHNTPHEVRVLLSFSLVLSLFAGQSGTAIASEACSLSALKGRYVGLENGFIQSQGRSIPAARLYQETWREDGEVLGTLWLRSGKKTSSMPYQGKIALGAECVATVSRTLPTGSWSTTAVYSPLSLKGYTIDRDPRSTLTGMMTRQGASPCSPKTLKGEVLSSQMGFSLIKGTWKPNAVIQKELHDGAGHVEGFAATSEHGNYDEVNYSGSFEVSPDCWGTLVEVDNEGTLYHYQVVIQAEGAGYFYLQTDPDDLTGAYLEHQP